MDESKALTIITYHYVRDPERTAFHGIKALGIDAFDDQLDYIERTFTPVSAAQVVAALKDGGNGLPPNPAWLTFDDGYRDHFDNVLPRLVGRKLTASFFPIARTATESAVLDFNKIQFVLAAEPNKDRLRDAVLRKTAEYRDEFDLDTDDAYLVRWAVPSRWDPAEVIFVKRMLQVGLPQAVRSRIVDDLFRQYVTADEAAFSDELYMKGPELRAMLGEGMHIGSHGHSHEWLSALAPDVLEHEIDLSLAFLSGLDVPFEDLVVCYPYGRHNDAVIEAFRNRGSAIGLTVRHGVARLGIDDPLSLPRMDTNYYRTQ